MIIADGVTMLRSSAGSHVFLVQADENILIDTGNRGQFESIQSELQSLGAEQLAAILLTHHDVDHIGNARRLQEWTGARVWASSEDIPYIAGEKNRPGIKWVVQSIIRPERPIIDGAYAPEQHFGEIQVIRSPGHTPGHVMFLYRRVLFSGDLVSTKNGELRLFPAYFTWNQQEVLKSLALLKTLEFDWLCPAHGEPVRRNDAVERFIRQY